ncbi:4-phosphoerythronate dehydrogenase PdxB [Marinobacterium sediminicola]|uniref:Erythronate-4-phosphate dehydrogenase n=1 Tax=Marinobacterium sediminicola TaxID=518898 RepID=A0ABY1RYX4_9GAMM|nr:4-phosphoerythronate dehydrogenase PdxB [Marinobacterium sediminicola]ULG67976.1 4-phosphoerythronate dehydrogenase PdxB [Marinobacterium sediminicola]SMR73516.1 erythronate-4-phosphate dehydrogenase [Marinobacterium sediminicola]
MTAVPHLTIVADENIPALVPLFQRFGTLRTCAGRSMTAEDLKDADVLLVRSVTRVSSELLKDTPVRFVGTATIGTDHVDQEWLHQQGIGFSSAPGCNADSVVEYVLSSLLQLAFEQRFSLLDKAVGIVGVGNVGGRLQQRLQAMGIQVLLCDPPRQAVEGGDFVSLDHVLKEADILALHTPLTREGDWPTYHLLNANNLPRLKQNAVLLNAGRGPVIDNAALLAVSQSRPDLTLVLDVWEHEPAVDVRLAERCAIATPHIAGYSLDGKIRGTWMLYKALCEHLQLPAELELGEVLPPSTVRELRVSDAEDLLTPARLVFDPYRDDRAFRKTLYLPADEQRLAFDRLRREYPERREYCTLKLVIEGDRVSSPLWAMGFDCAGGGA